MAFITIKKRTIIIALSVVLAAVALAAGVTAVIASTRTDNGITIVIDAGHGGADGGVTGIATGAKESDVNLSIAKYLSRYLKDNGYNVEMTRTDAGAVSGGIKYSKRDDMRARKDKVNAAAPDLLISIHCNSYPLESVSGGQVFFSSNATVGRDFANTVQNYFNDVLNEKPRTAAVGDYYILNCSDYPSILCECGFLTNKSEESKLITSSYQEKVAYTIFTAVDAMFGNGQA